MRFKNKLHGMNMRKHSWVCLSCNHQAREKMKTCSVCGNDAIQYFASNDESKRYFQLRLYERQGIITNLKMQPSFPCRVGPTNSLITTYKADFQYTDNKGETITEDVKGQITDVFKLKQKLVKALHNTDLRIVRM